VKARKLLTRSLGAEAWWKVGFMQVSKLSLNTWAALLQHLSAFAVAGFYTYVTLPAFVCLDLKTFAVIIKQQSFCLFRTVTFKRSTQNNFSE